MPEHLPRWMIVLFGCCVALAAQAADSTEPPNIVFILFDDLGYADLGCYGARHATPRMDALAAEGLLAESFFVAQPVCSASRAGYLTGRLPHRIGVRGAIFPGERRGLPDGVPTIANILKARGYATGVFGKWHLGNGPAFHPFQRGFDEFVGIPYSHDMAPASPYANGRFSPLPLYEGERLLQADPPFDTLTETLTARACAFVRQHKAGPFFLYLPHPMPHTPLAASERFRGTTGLGLFADVLAELDDSVGRVLDTLHECGVEQRTLVILASDNGPWLQMGAHSGSAGALREGKGTTFEGGVRVPCIVRWPGRVPAGTRTKIPFGAIDLLPTLAEVAGIGIDPASVDGRSALPLWIGQSVDSPRASYAFYYDGPKLQSIRSGPWKYHVAHRYRTMDGGKWPAQEGLPGEYAQRDLGESLMDLAAEVGEVTDVKEREAATLTEMRGLAAAELQLDKALDRVPDHFWPGPAWMPSRLQDWRRRGESIHCATDKLPFRTLHRLRERIRVRPRSTGSLHVEVELENAGLNWRTDACAGFILGCGRQGDDPRVAEVVQQAPGTDGGFLAVLASDGTLRLLDFSVPRQEGHAWSLPGDTTLAHLPVLAQSKSLLKSGGHEGGSELLPGRCTLVLEGRLVSDGLVSVRLTLRSQGQELASTPEVEIASAQIDGSLGLVAHHVPASLAFKGFSASGKSLLELDPSREFGPLFGTLYTVNHAAGGGGELRITAQMAPFPARDYGTFGLDLATLTVDDWRAVGEGTYDEASGTVCFPATPVPRGFGLRWRVRGTWLATTNTWHDFVATGLVRAAPSEDEEARVAMLSCVKGLTVTGAWNSNGVWYPHADLVANVLAHDPQLIVFAGDQYYESDFTAPERGATVLLDAATRWMRFHRAFGPLLRDRPVLITPDDHDVYQGNLWGAGGVAAVKRSVGDPPRAISPQDGGGYTMPVPFINAVHRMQCAHLPPSVVEPELSSGITTFTTRVTFGPFDCAVLSDRMWKGSASVHLPLARVTNGFPAVSGVSLAAPSAHLLGPSQERFLEDWSVDRRSGSPVRLAISQSPFVCAQTLPAGKTDAWLGMAVPPKIGAWPEGDVPTRDCDSNGWPIEARTRAVQLLQAAGAIHLTGDQHLAVTLRYGMDTFADGPFAISSPAVGNAWYRRWMPASARPQDARWWRGGLGSFEDGFGNPFTMLAVANPAQRGATHDALHDYSPGYAIVRVAATTRRVSLEAWPREADPLRGGEPFPGWPVFIE